MSDFKARMHQTLFPLVELTLTAPQSPYLYLRSLLLRGGTGMGTGGERKGQGRKGQGRGGRGRDLARPKILAWPLYGIRQSRDVSLGLAYTWCVRWWRVVRVIVSTRSSILAIPSLSSAMQWRGQSLTHVPYTAVQDRLSQRRHMTRPKIWNKIHHDVLCIN